MTTIIELDRRVFEVVTEGPDTPEVCQRTLTVQLLSGESLTKDEWLYLMNVVRSRAEALGLTKIKCQLIPK